MNKMKFEAQQYLIRQAEIDLYNKTQKLLIEMLNCISKDELNKFENYTISSNDEFSETIISVNEYKDFFYIHLQDYFNNERRIGIDDLSQEQQKDLIDFIIDNFSLIEK